MSAGEFAAAVNPLLFSAKKAVKLLSDQPPTANLEWLDENRREAAECLATSEGAAYLDRLGARLERGLNDLPSGAPLRAGHFVTDVRSLLKVVKDAYMLGGL